MKNVMCHCAQEGRGKMCRLVLHTGLLLWIFLLAGCGTTIYCRDYPFCKDLGEDSIAALGIGAVPASYYGTPQTRPMAVKAATVDAMKNLKKCIQALRLSNGLCAGDAISSAHKWEAMELLIKKESKTVKREYFADGTLEVTVTISRRKVIDILTAPER